MRKIKTLKEPPSLSREHIETIMRSLATVFPQYGVGLAYLFGSYGRLMRGEGRPGRLSDVDVAVLFRENRNPYRDSDSHNTWTGERMKDSLSLIGELYRAFRRDDIDFVVLNDAPPLLRDRVIRSGWVLYCDDELSRIRFVVRTRREYFDTKPLRDVCRKYLFERIGGGYSGTRYRDNS